jgi:monovalent cation/proton antiporter MnhG/PhaG subunit
MSLHKIAIDVSLAIVVLASWIGVIGMLRMRHPLQALHYLTLPATVGVFALTIAVLLDKGLRSVTYKMALIALVLLAINSVVTHATGRAFRVRQLGHWEPKDGDRIQLIHRKTPVSEEVEK